MWQKIPYRNYFLTACILNVLTLIIPFALKRFLPPVIPLLYGRPYGSEQLVSVLALAIAPGAATLVTLLNLFFSIWSSDTFIRRVLAISAVLVSALTTIAVVKAVGLVGFF